MIKGGRSTTSCMWSDRTKQHDEDSRRNYRPEDARIASIARRSANRVIYDHIPNNMVNRSHPPQSSGANRL